jgi:alcohol dehydrogenase class IV
LNQGVPFVAVPTTAGTGTEATRNAVLDVPEHHLKVSLRSPFLLPRLAVVDPDLTRSLPPDVTAYTGMDALTQLIGPSSAMPQTRSLTACAARG